MHVSERQLGAAHQFTAHSSLALPAAPTDAAVAAAEPTGESVSPAPGPRLAATLGGKRFVGKAFGGEALNAEAVALEAAVLKGEVLEGEVLGDDDRLPSSGAAVLRNLPKASARSGSAPGRRTVCGSM